jgi:fatty acid desaturase
VYLLAIYALLALALARVVPVWTLLVFIPPLYVRSALIAHELMHICKDTQVPLLHRLMMILETPLCLGYREHRDIHLRHHQAAATERDPEYFQIRGGHLRAFAGAMVSPEWSLVHYLREKGSSRTLAAEATVRLTVFAMAAWWNPVVFLVYWVTLRLSVGVSAFVFHHALHYRGGRYGTFRLRPPGLVDRAIRFVLGTEPALILYEHPAHHRWQQVKALRLPDLNIEASPVGAALAPAPS